MVRRLRSFGGWRGLDETQDIAVRIADVKLCAVWHVAQRNNECNARRSKMLRECLCAANCDVGINVLRALKRHLIPRRGSRALEMNVAAIATDAGIKALINELDSEAEAVAIEVKRAGHVGDSENGRDVSEAFWSFGHRVGAHTSNEN